MRMDHVRGLTSRTSHSGHKAEMISECFSPLKEYFCIIDIVECMSAMWIVIPHPLLHIFDIFHFRTPEKSSTILDTNWWRQIYSELQIIDSAACFQKNKCFKEVKLVLTYMPHTSFTNVFHLQMQPLQSFCFQGVALVIDWMFTVVAMLKTSITQHNYNSVSNALSLQQ